METGSGQPICVCQPHLADGGRGRCIAQDLERGQSCRRLCFFVAAVDIGDGGVDAHGGERSADGDGTHLVSGQLDRYTRDVWKAIVEGAEAVLQECISVQPRQGCPAEMGKAVWLFHWMMGHGENVSGPLQPIL